MNKRVFEASLIVTGLALAALAPVSRSQAVPTAHHACLDEERQAIENGEGFGMALAADRNGYPGPKHILELREQLGLTPAQQAQAQQLFDRMRADALAAGRKLLDKESELERHFASAAAGTARVRRLLEESAGLRAELRWVHLSAHLAARDLLTSEQRARYHALRHSSAEHAH